MQTNSQIRQSSLAAMKGNWGSAILLYVVSCVLYVPYGILNRGGAIAGLAVLLLIFVYLPINFGLLRTFLAFARDKRPPDHRRTVLRIQQYLLLESHRNGPVIWNLHVPLDVAAHRPRHHQGTVVCNGAVHRIRQSGNRLRRGDRTQYGNDARTQDAIISQQLA